MLDWSYEYVQKRHAEARAKCDKKSRAVLEEWLETLVGPALAKREPLPYSFVGVASYLKPSEAELRHMAKQLGWYLNMGTVRYGMYEVKLSQIFDTHVPTIDSKWDIEAVRAQKKRNDEARLKDVRAIISEAVKDRIGELNGLPTVFPLDVTVHWVKEHQDELAMLGWTAFVCVAGRWYLRGC